MSLGPRLRKRRAWPGPLGRQSGGEVTAGDSAAIGEMRIRADPWRGPGENTTQLCRWGRAQSQMLSPRAHWPGLSKVHLDTPG